MRYCATVLRGGFETKAQALIENKSSKADHRSVWWRSNGKQNQHTWRILGFSSFWMYCTWIILAASVSFLFAFSHCSPSLSRNASYATLWSQPQAGLGSVAPECGRPGSGLQGVCCNTTWNGGQVVHSWALQTAFAALKWFTTVHCAHSWRVYFDNDIFCLGGRWNSMPLAALAAIVRSMICQWFSKNMIAGPYSRAPRLCLSLLGPSQYPEAKLLILVLNGCEG